MSEPAPPDPELAALYVGERHAPGVSPADRQRIRAQVLATVGVVAAATTSAATAHAATSASAATAGTEASATSAGAATIGTAATATAGAEATAAGTVAGAVGSTGKLVTIVLALGAVGGGTAALLHDRDPSAPRAADALRLGPRASGGADPALAEPLAAAEVTAAEPTPELAAGGSTTRDGTRALAVPEGARGLAVGRARVHDPTRALAAGRSTVGVTASDASAPNREPPQRRSRGAAPAARSPATGSEASLVVATPDVPEVPEVLEVPERPDVSTARIIADRDVVRAELTRAWKLLARGDASGSLAVLARIDGQHADAPLERIVGQHADAPLAEEREAISILALVRAGRAAEARPRASAFVARFPSSIHRAAIERALATSEKPSAEVNTP